MRRAAYLTGRSYRGKHLPPGAVPPLEIKSRELIAAAGESQNITFETEYWDERNLPSRGYDLAIIRTCWDYHERPQQFVETLEAHERAGLRVFNAPSVVKWNARKTYLKELGDCAIPTIWVERVDGVAIAQAFEALDAHELIVKPQIGAGSRNTVRIERSAWTEAHLVDGPKSAAMIQPFLQAIETEGEWSLFWFGDVYSHAIRKMPARGDWRANIPGETHFVAATPSREAMHVAEFARMRAPSDLLYVRIDLVLGDDAQWRVIEIEAIEPYLFLDFAPEGARTFVDAIARVLG